MFFLQSSSTKSQSPSQRPGSHQQQPSLSNTAPVQRQTPTTVPPSQLGPPVTIPPKQQPVPPTTVPPQNQKTQAKSTLPRTGPQQERPSLATPQTPPNLVSTSTHPEATSMLKCTAAPTKTTQRSPQTGASSSFPAASTGLPPSQGPNNHGKKQPPDRPEFGKKGRQIMVRANFFPVQLPRHLTIHQYDVSIAPPSKYPKWMCRKIFESMKAQYSESVFQGQKCAFDGNKNIYCHKILTSVGDKKLQLQVELHIEGDSNPRTFSVTLQKVNSMHIDTGRIESILRDATEQMPLIQALDIIMRHLPSLKMEPIGRSFFSQPAHPYNLGQGVEVWPGYYQSLRPTMGWKFKLNLDTSSTAFYTEQSVVDFMCTLLRVGRDATRDLTEEDKQKFTIRELTDSDRKRLDRDIKGLKIEVTHLPYPRKYKVLSVTRSSAENQTFPLDNGTTSTVAKYFREHKSIILKYPHLPCLHVGQKSRNVYIPLELCKLVGGQRCTRKMNEIQTANMIKAVTKPADVREREINEKFRDSGIAKDPILKDFGITVSDRMVTIPARVLDSPSLKYNGKQTVKPPGDKGAWEMRGEKFYQGATVNGYAVLVLSKFVKDFEVDKFTSMLEKAGRERGMTFNGRKIVKFHNPFGRGAASIETIFTELKTQVNLIVAIIDKGGTLYSEVKLIGDTTEAGVATQCVLSNTVQRKCNPATLGNICLKINPKLGGVNNIIDPFSRPPIFRTDRVIVFGADVTHPKAGDTTTPSIAAVVASMDLTASKFKGKHHVQKHRQEIIAELKKMTKELLIDFYRANGKIKPSCIIFYRDGVSEGQFDQVRINEIAAIQQACTELGSGYEPKITFIVCQKRHHTRLFPVDRKDAGKGNNVPPGTIVEKEITHSNEFDFYLCSHAAIQGTSRPCHYHVLWDDNNFTSDDLQILSYQLCHTFWRCNRSVSYPAPAYYAHRAAAHARVLYQANEDRWSSDGGSMASGSVDMDTMDKDITIHIDRSGDMYFM